MDKCKRCICKKCKYKNTGECEFAHCTYECNVRKMCAYEMKSNWVIRVEEIFRAIKRRMF